MKLTCSMGPTRTHGSFKGLSTSMCVCTSIIQQEQLSEIARDKTGRHRDVEHVYATAYMYMNGSRRAL